MATSVGQRGKWAEAKVKVWLAARSAADIKFDFYRYPDARAGSFATVPADFEAVSHGVPFLVEVKELKHNFRLPGSNFSADKVARMNKRMKAGSQCWVIVCHIPEKLWRLVPLDEFLERKPSWDLRAYPATDDLGSIMNKLFDRA